MKPAELAARKPTLDPAVAAAYDMARRVSGQVVVGGKLQPARSRETFPVEYPGDESEIGVAARCDAQDVNWAVEVAQRAFEGWSKVPPRERGERLRRVAECIEREQEALARLLCLDTGNALSTQARPEVGAMIEILRLFAGLASELKGRTLPWDANTLCYTTRDPLGVVGAIIPWNAPLFLTAVKLAPALVAGNTVVLKSAEQAPLAVTRVLEIMQEELPPGVANALSGFGEEAGRPLAEHPLVRKLSFTGSCAVGKQIMHYAADKLCPVTLELGGKSPNIVLPDADLDLVIAGIVTGMRFTRQGQSCSAGTRLFLHEAIADEVIARLLRELDKLKLGNPLDEQTQVGALISREQLDRVVSYVELARRTPGSRILCGGSRPRDPMFARGHYYLPTLIEGVPHDSPVCQDEIFGPVAVILRWKDFDAMLAQANGTSFGLAASLWTRDLNRALSFARDIQAGFVQVNQYITPRATLAYGGVKMSGLGKENTLESMLEHFTASRTVLVNLGTPAR